MVRFGFLCCDFTLFSGVTRPYEILTAVNAMSRLQRQESNLSLELLRVDDIQPNVVGGLPINISKQLSQDMALDWLFLPPSWRSPSKVLRRYPELPRLLKAYHQRGTKLVATGAGVYFLAEAGLLDDSPATTHWYFFDDFSARYPQVDLKRQHFITYGDGVYCAGSINALSDLVFYLVGLLYGKEKRQRVEQHFAHDVGSSHDVPIFAIGHALHSDEAIVGVQEWLSHVYADDITLSAMADYSGMPMRTFTRRFKHALGMTPNQYLQDLRLEKAADYLKTTDLSVQDIALTVGYKDTPYFAKIFKASAGLTPTEYRKVIRPKLFRMAKVESLQP